MKVSVGLKGFLPASIRFCKEQKDSSEDISLVRAINEAKVEKEDILLFDPGIAKGEKFEEFWKKDYKFVTRINVGRKYSAIKVNNCKEHEDLIVHIYSMHKKIQTPLRILKIINKDGNDIWFLTNLLDMQAVQIAELYKRRLDT